MTRRDPRLIVGVMLTAWLASAAAQNAPRPVRWEDLAPAVRDRLQPRGLSESTFPAYLQRQRDETDRRLRDGNFDHLVYYALQSTRFTSLPPIEPALSARAFVEDSHRASVPVDARARLTALATALNRARNGVASGRHDPPTAPRHAGAGSTDASEDVRLALFRDVIAEAGVGSHGLPNRLEQEYMRAMGFLYEKEFVAARGTNARAATATLYQARSHSTDTQIEAGYAVSVALATLKALESAGPEAAVENRSAVRRPRFARVLIIGPGLDIAPRTGLLESAPPQSYQPFAVADALLSLGLADRDALRIDLADINPIVIRHFTRLASSTAPLPMTIVSGLRDDARTRLSEDYRAYVRQLGDSLTASAAIVAPERGRTILIDPMIPRAMTPIRANIVCDRLPDARPYDLIVITNVLPYFTDPDLLIALSNISSLLAPGAYLVHNEPRALLLETAAAIGLPAVQSRSVLLASPVGGAPLHDTVLLHRKN
jgi:hypothetical protein